MAARKRTRPFRLLASGDHHFDQHSRFAECVRVHDWMLELARDREVDLFLSGGDVYERASTPVERQAVAAWLQGMSEVCPVVVAKGNHDRPLDVALMRELRSDRQIIVEERAAVHVVAGAAIATVAWPERSTLLASGLAGDAADTAIREALQNVLRGLGDQLQHHDGPRILLGHFMVDGAITSTGQPLLGMPINVGLADLALARAHLGIMGHIHRAARYDVAGAPHFYTGSPFRRDFGQLEKKSVLLAEFEGARLVRTEEIETPATPMIHVTGEWSNHNGQWSIVTFDTADGQARIGGMPGTFNGRFYKGAELRFRYRVASDQREAARHAAEQWRDMALSIGVGSVKLEEELIVEQRARAPELARASTIAEKLEQLWAVKRFEPGERRGELLAKASTVEAEASHAA